MYKRQIEGCKNPKSVTILVRSGNKRLADEVERSLNDALNVVKDVIIHPLIVAGGGAPEAEAAAKIREWASKLTGREQLAAIKFAETLESIPLTLAENSGLDVIDIGVKLRAKHKKGNVWAGVECTKGSVSDMLELNIVEPLAVKEQIIKSATEATSMILRIDDVIASTKTSAPAGPPGGCLLYTSPSPRD